jgi:hypothetical protein
MAIITSLQPRTRRRHYYPGTFIPAAFSSPYFSSASLALFLSVAFLARNGPRPCVLVTLQRRVPPRPPNHHDDVQLVKLSVKPLLPNNSPTLSAAINSHATHAQSSLIPWSPCPSTGGERRAYVISQRRPRFMYKSIDLTTRRYNPDRVQPCRRQPQLPPLPRRPSRKANGPMALFPPLPQLPL